MKKTNKFAIISAFMLTLCALSFTGCNFGKDDFYGTWQSGTFARPSDGKTIRVTFYFSGKSENLTAGNKAYFYEYYENFDDGINTFWFGTYGLGENQDITNGTLTLRYLYGIGMEGKNGTPYSLDTLITDSQTVRFNKKGDNSITTFQNNYKDSKRYYDQFDETTATCSDVEKFDFKLDGAVAFQGYTQMVCTAKCQWWEDGVTAANVSTGATSGSTKKNPASGTSWGKEGVTRSFTLTNNNGSEFVNSDFSSTSIFAGSLPVLNTVSEYAEVALTPEK